MADIKLGPEGAEVTLPPISWEGGRPPELLVEFGSAAEKEEMADGSWRWNFKSKIMRSWPLRWERLTAAQYAQIRSLYLAGEPLRFQYGYIDDTWHWVVFTRFEPSPKIVTFLGSEPLYSLEITLEESA